MGYRDRIGCQLDFGMIKDHSSHSTAWLRATGALHGLRRSLIHFCCHQNSIYRRNNKDGIPRSTWIILAPILLSLRSTSAVWRVPLSWCCTVLMPRTPYQFSLNCRSMTLSKTTTSRLIVHVMFNQRMYTYYTIRGSRWSFVRTKMRRVQRSAARQTGFSL